MAKARWPPPLGIVQKYCLLRFGVGPQTLERIGTSEGDAGLVGSLKDHIGSILVFNFHTIWGKAVVWARCVRITVVEVNRKWEGKMSKRSFTGAQRSAEVKHACLTLRPGANNILRSSFRVNFLCHCFYFGLIIFKRSVIIFGLKRLFWRLQIYSVKFWCFASSTTPRVFLTRLPTLVSVLPAVKVPQSESNSQQRFDTTNRSRHSNQGRHLNRDVTGTGFEGHLGF
ncbi:hypothetical protein DFH07DRAFT_984824 [Mycena maculata]|uniref:Uncharacterized protein n=1 Tax=Mycena maculata TaxID=230809 RepID=A0AAD7K4U4_9AGAR|nr:hypothetical protein DFH07DRAFT_984824 [Mycena maculata]